MSLATLARKTRAKQRVGTRGKFILNMTGRGNVLGMNAKMSRGNCKGLTKCAGKRAACCVGVGGDEPGCCRFPHGGKPAPQMGYGVYLNRKSKGAYHPGGGKQCKTLPGCERAKIVWKQGSNLDASVVSTNKKDNVLACNSDVYTAKRDTCTGCADCRGSSSLTVGLSCPESVPGDDLIFWGFGRDLTGTYGAFVPPIINGNAINSLFCTGTTGLTPEPGTGGLFVINAPGVIAETMFSSISIVNCEEKTVRTYYQGAAAFDNTSGCSSWSWNASASGFSIADELTYWRGAYGKTLQVYIDNPNPFSQCCCPVKKNICGCRATDLVRYTRINKSFGCQTTKAVKQGRTASEQIARNRAKVDCIKPPHKTIYITYTGPFEGSTFSFDGGCGSQCLIQGQKYTFVINTPLFDTAILDGSTFAITWCPGITDTFTTIPLTNGTTTIVSFTVPKFNTSSNCTAPTYASIYPTYMQPPSKTLTLDYCKQAYKRPQMLGSCSGR